MSKTATGRGIADRFGQWLDDNLLESRKRDMTLGDLLGDIIRCLDDAVEKCGEDASNGEILQEAINQARTRLVWELGEEERESRGKPVVTGQHRGNIFPILDAAAGALEKSGAGADTITEMRRRSLAEPLYQGKVRVVREYVRLEP